MEQYVFFITNHWILASLLAVVLAIFIVNEFLQRRLGTTAISPEAAVQWINHQEAVVFDCRSESLFVSGHILGSERVSLTTLDKKINSLQKYLNKPIIVTCLMGQESPKLVEKLKQNGFQNMVILKGGIDAWKAAGLPLVKA